MHVMRRQKTSKAFALPTVLIASIVLLMILAVSVTATVAVRTTLMNQYYVQLAQVAGESGVAYAKACLAANGNVPQWTDVKPLTPATDCSGNLILSPTVKALVVGGGGSGGGTAGGGGAGGYLYNDSVTVSATSYPVTVGAGGAAPGNSASNGNVGGVSSFGGLNANGGGYGATHGGNVGGNGGSGGGGGMLSNATGVGGAGGVGNQGNNGGLAPSISGWVGNNGGGGGAGGPGGAGGNTAGTAAGGAGVTNNITGSMVYYAAGGGGGEVNGSYVGAGGSGIGGSGQVDTVGTAGVPNTGSGGGGGSYNGSYLSGGAGGSGVVIISYPVNSGIIATGGAITTSGGNKIHKFTTSGTFTVTSAGSASCPSDSRCSVTVNGNVRSSFNVPKPTVDANGQAITIPNSGYVEVTRTSNGSVWRTYKQPNVQNAVVPDLCSGNATTARGWNAAVKTTQQDALASASTAQTISLADATINTGVIYFRKDFNASDTASYDVNIYTSSSQDIAATYIDGQLITTASGELSTASTTLTAGCHTMVVQLTNDAYLPRASRFTASLTRPGAATPVVVSNPTWRVTAGDPAHYSSSSYYESPSAWEQVYDFGVWNNTALPWGGAPGNWQSVSGDSLAEYISTQYSSGGTNRPGDSYAWFRDPQPFTTATATTVRVTNYCDDQCNLYLDGNLVMSPTSGSGINSKSISVQPGTHTFGIRLYNAPTGNVGAVLFAAVDLTTNQVLDRSSPNWDATTSWSSANVEPYSYDATYIPTPVVQKTANAKLLVVGGGGGGGSDMGGGGGAGGVVYNAAYPLSTGTYNVTVGAGGPGAPAGISQVRGYNGGNSLFGTTRALGGGGGGSEYSTNASPPGAGASAGGSAGCNQNLYAGFVISQGNGSAGTPGCYYPTGGGGAGGPGAANPGTGGVGISNNILGTTYFFGGGGGGSGYSGNGGNGGNGGGGGGAVGATTGGSGINAGSAGGGGTAGIQTNKPGGNGGPLTGGGGGGGSHYNLTNNGGNGGSGVVVVSFPTGTLSVLAVIGGSDVSSSTPGFTTFMFSSNGYITINGVN
ncbi:MAG: hypothetical protein JWN12_754 [Candidatus Saccharibacteria bacterium]|nr:hypothetical protein [Candidatus Saccharibacteria bacterium]